MSLASLIATGTTVWLDGVAPEQIKQNRDLGVTGATSNPTIVSHIVGSRHFDDRVLADYTKDVIDNSSMTLVGHR